jgi:hypothetical protein
MLTALMAIAALMPLAARPALAQNPPEPQKRTPLPLPPATALPPVPAAVGTAEKQSPINPYPKDAGDNQNRGRGSADLYWGILNGNTPHNRVPLSRVQNVTTNPRLIELDGWGFPRGASLNGNFLLRPSVLVDDQLAGTLPSNVFVAVNAPASGFTQPQYFRANAIPRPNLPATQYPASGVLNNKFAWNLNAIQVQGTVAGQQVRFQIRARIPLPPDVNISNPSDPLAEPRITDARYTVYYYIRNGAGGFEARQKTFTVSQVGGGEEPLLNADGQPAFFPLFTTATAIAAPLPDQPGIGAPFQGVLLDDTTENVPNQGEQLFVVADSLNLVQSIDTVAATPTVTRPHGGRIAADSDPVAPGVQPWPVGAQPLQPRVGSQQPDPAGGVNPVPVDENSFINNPRVPVNPTQTAIGRPYDPANPSTLFRGPESLVDPRLVLPTRPTPDPVSGEPVPQFPAYPSTPGAPDPANRALWPSLAPGMPDRPFTQILDPFTGATIPGGLRPGTSVDATNHDIYRFNLLTRWNPANPNYNPADPATNPSVPLFSHMQVLMARTEFALDPETGVPDSEKDGTLTIQVGSVWSLDWLTGAPIWRFPDRTYAPGNVRNPYVTGFGANVATTFDPSDPAILRDPVTGERITLVPGIRLVDKNLDNVIEDDEVFIVGQGINTGGGIFAGITYVPHMPVRGAVQIPVYQPRDPVTGIQRIHFNPNIPAAAPVPAAPGRYSTAPDPMVPGSGFQPVEIGVAYIAAANGVIYAVDAYGNNDNDYFPNQADFRRFGTYRPGTTNVLWTFSTSNTLRQPGETRAAYFQRLKQEIPGTGSFGASAPTIAFQRDERDLAANPPVGVGSATGPFNPFEDDEPRLFVGNQNGVLYAMDARADAGNIFAAGGLVAGARPLPFRKESDRPVLGIGPAPTFPPTFGPSGLKWWFETRGGINATPAVSLMRQNAGGATDINGNVIAVRKGIYVTSLEGRVYCLDWEGPVTKAQHHVAVNYDVDNAAVTAQALNDNFRFHNITPATPNANPDNLEGAIRPRWTFPNLYRDINAGDTPTTDPADEAVNNPNATTPINGVAGIRLADPETTIGPITTAPSLIDFPWTDPLVAGAPRHLSYLAFQANDATTSGLPAAQGRLYLLDQVGDRENFLTNTIARGTGNNRRVFAHPKDRFSPGVPIGDSAPIWTYRYVYDWYTGADTGTRNMDRRNNPIIVDAGLGNPPITAAELTGFTADGNAYGERTGLPGRRVVPTLFAGGIGRLYALDFDLETGLFLRWRPGNVDNMRPFQSLPEFPNIAGLTWNDLFPADVAVRDRLDPIDPIFGTTAPAARQALAARPLLVRTVVLPAEVTTINHMTVSGGPLQNRSTPIAYLPPFGAAGPVPGLPTVPPGLIGVNPPTVPPDGGGPTNDAPNLRPLYIDVTDLTRFDVSGLFVNQDINDPITTTEGARGTNPNPINGFPQPDPANRIPNTAYQFPTLFVSDEDGNLFSISTNIEGEDRETALRGAFAGNPAIPADNESTTTGWAIFGVDDLRFTENHIYQFSVNGPGGPGGVAVVTNAYFPALDPGFANTARAVANPNDPFRFYPFGEPNTTTPTPFGVAGNPLPVGGAPLANNDDPRPDFRPRSFARFSTADPGPDGTLGTADDVPTSPPDWETGLSGFPLDHNGLFFDKRFAGQRAVGEPAPTMINNGFQPIVVGNAVTPIPGQHPNGDFQVRLRLPGYSFIGALAGPDPTLAETDENNQIPDGARTDHTSGNSVVDDINPSAQNVTWVFSGGPNGLLYAYTPASRGQTSGFVAGTQQGTSNPGDQGNPTVAIVDEATYNQVIADAADGSFDPNWPVRLRAASIARNGGRNFYEYGETVYVVVFDLLAQTRNPVGPNPPLYDPVNDWFINGALGSDNSVQIEIRNANTGAIAARTQVSLQPAYYYLTPDNPLVGVMDPTDDAILVPGNTNALPLGIALYRLNLGNPSTQNPQTPGDVLQVNVSQPGISSPLGNRVRLLSRRGGVGGNRFVQDILGNPDIYFSIANPLAVQGFLVETAPQGPGVPLRRVGVKANAADTANAIGPFAAAAPQNGGVKNEVVDDNAVPGTNDPDRGAFDYSQALTNGNELRRRNLRRFIDASTTNPRFRGVVRTQNGEEEPPYYFPIITSAGFVNHGDSGSTDTGTNQQNLRIMNRALLANLNNVRVTPSDQILWRAWPGRVPNANANLYNPDGTLPAAGDAGNERYFPKAPQVMDQYGRINPLPWETGINDPKPWNPTAPPNMSPDYPNIPTRANNVVRVQSGIGGNLTNGTATLPAGITGAGSSLANTSVPAGVNPGPLSARLAVSAQLTVPKYQPANVVATHSQTSTYVAPSPEDDNTVALGTNPGPVQLPRNLASRELRILDNNGIATGQRAITPYGYTARMYVFLDYNNTGTLLPTNVQQRITGIDPNNRQTTTSGAVTKAYREFEMAFGVPVDMGLKVVESDIDLGQLGHSFGMQNGLMGYGSGAGPYLPGLLPSPLFDTTGAFPNNTLAPYDKFFKKFTVTNTGNVNMWNLRASQRIEVASGNPQTYAWGSGDSFTYFGLRSDTVDGRHGILAVGADPLVPLLGQPNLMPQVVTSLDRQYDAAWDQYLQTGPAMFSAPYVQPILAGQSPYQLYYQSLGGRHTLHKARVGANAPSVLGVPDLPANQFLRPQGDPLGQPASVDTRVSVAVPLGTPSGTYSSKFAATPLVVFEDHDTAAPYNPIPVLTGNNFNSVAPAGPFYGNSQVVHPGLARPILSAGGGNGEGIFRARRFVLGPNNQITTEFQPFTDPGINVKLTVTEVPLTGDVADRAVEAAGVPYSIASGRLPGIDLFPLVDTSNNSIIPRPMAALSPAAYRSANGNLNVYFTRNATGAQPGQPFKLFHSRMVWNTALGTWQAVNPGTPLLNSTTAATAANNVGHWLSSPVEVNPGGAGEANISPFVLQGPAGATLYWVNVSPTTSGVPRYQLVWSTINPNTGVPDAPALFFANSDASVQRLSPRAMYYINPTPANGQPTNPASLLFYYGGTPGKWSLYYGTRLADANGAPSDATPNLAVPGGPSREVSLTLPASIASASDPVPIFRDFFNAANPAAPFKFVDVYYTGILRSTQTPDIFMSRYRVDGSNAGLRLAPFTLPRVRGEELNKPGRDPLYQAKHVEWFRSLQQAGRLPIIYIGQTATAANVIQIPAPGRTWQYDSATGLLYQTFTRNGQETVCLVDTSAGTVRFRGRGAPSGSEYVFADYEPQAYRVTAGGTGNLTPFSVQDNSVAVPLTTANPGRGLSNTVERLTGPLPLGRNWLVWQKSSSGGRPATMYYTSRRIGIDLKNGPVIAGPLMTDKESILLSSRNAQGNQFPQVQSVTVAGVGPVPYEVDYVSGKLFIDPQYEGLQVEVQYRRFTPGGSVDGTPTQVTAIAGFVEELPQSQQGVTGVQVPVRRAVNEAQPYVFLDTFVPTGITRTNPAPIIDPTLTPGRLWLFWTSSRGREGSQIVPFNGAPHDPFPGGFDLYWQTLAPQFEPLVFPQVFQSPPAAPIP